jgi:hypothetical protein
MAVREQMQDLVLAGRQVRMRLRRRLRSRWGTMPNTPTIRPPSHGDRIDLDQGPLSVLPTTTTVALVERSVPSILRVNDSRASRPAPGDDGRLLPAADVAHEIAGRVVDPADHSEAVDEVAGTFT